MKADPGLKKEMFKGHMDAVLLCVVAEHGSIYGFDITRRVLETSHGSIRLKAGSLYPSLHRLALKGWMSVTNGPSPRGGAPVTFYAITGDGLVELAHRRLEYQRLQVALNAFLAAGDAHGPINRSTLPLCW